MGRDSLVVVTQERTNIEKQNKRTLRVLLLELRTKPRALHLPQTLEKNYTLMKIVSLIYKILHAHTHTQSIEWPK